MNRAKNFPPTRCAWLWLKALAICVWCMTTATLATAQDAAPIPDASLYANGYSQLSSAKGWPLIFTFDLSHPQEGLTNGNAAPISVNSSSGNWADTIRIVVHDSSGNVQSWPLQLFNSASATAGPLTITGNLGGRLTWTINPTNSAQLPEGVYELVGIFDNSGSANLTGFHGSLVSNPVSLTIISEPATLSANDAKQKALSFTLYDALLGNQAAALNDLAGYLATQPQDVGALTLQGDMLAEQGQYASALTSFTQALAVSPHTAADPEVPSLLERRQTEMSARLLSQGGDPGVPGITASLGAQGLQTAGVYFFELTLTNSGTGAAQNITLNDFNFVTTAGSGQVTSDQTSPGVPLGADFLLPNNSTRVRIYLDVPSTVNGFTISFSGGFSDLFGVPFAFSFSQGTSLNSSGGGGGTSGRLTITGPSVAQVYGQSMPSLNNVTYSGFVNGDGPTSLTGALSCVTTAMQSSPVGSYPITCSGLTSSKYTILFVPGTLAITPALLKITASNAVRQFGQPNPVFTASYSAFANADTVVALSGALTCSTPATSASSVSGSPYPVNCSGLSSANYAITFVTGSLVITKATPIVTWSNPPDIGLGLPLGSAQLNATSSVTGQFVYTPPAGTVLTAGNAQRLSVAFTATDTTDYNSANASVLINVKAILGDVNGDGVVNCADIAIIKASFGKKAGQAGFDTRADVNGDSVVNVIDLATVAKQLPAGTSCP
jgi:hypothetical protein